jgi:hypothetical protein
MVRSSDEVNACPSSAVPPDYLSWWRWRGARSPLGQQAAVFAGGAGEDLDAQPVLLHQRGVLERLIARPWLKRSSKR